MAGSQIQALVIIPDEITRSDLKKSFGAYPGIQVVQESKDWGSVEKLELKRLPDAIFADPLVGKKETLDWIDEVPRSVAVVLVAANARLAVQAFEKRVLDYLLKPLTARRLDLAIERLVEWKALHARHARDAKGERRITIQTRRESSVIRAQSISSIRAEGNYTSLLLHGGERKLVHRSLRQWRKLLPEGFFFQIHRSTLVNLDQVRYLERKEEGKSFLHLQGQAEPLSVSRRLATQLRLRLKVFRQT